MRKFRNIISGVIWTLVGLYVTLIVLLHIPAVQSFIGTKAGEILSEKFDTKVSVGRVDIGFLNRLIVDDLQMFDQNQRPLLKASRASVKIDLLELAKGKISIKYQYYRLSYSDLMPTYIRSLPTRRLIFSSFLTP